LFHRFFSIFITLNGPCSDDIRRQQVKVIMYTMKIEVVLIKSQRIMYSDLTITLIPQMPNILNERGKAVS